MAGYKLAFSLSKPEVADAKPPGTVTLIGKSLLSIRLTPSMLISSSEHLEWAASQTSHDELRLVPTPSADPADPLNFSWLRKVGILVCMSLFPFVVNFTSASISSALPVYGSTPIFGLPPKPFSELTQLLAVRRRLLAKSFHSND